MKVLYSIMVGILLLVQHNLSAQSPYAIAPKWYFGRQGGINFSGGAPVVLTGGQVNGNGQEASSTMCDPDGNVVFYTDSRRLYSGNHTLVQNINGGTSSTNSSVSFPDPADPANRFYLVTANQDAGGGGDFSATLGIHYYHIEKTGPGTISVLAGPVQLASGTEVSEQLCGGTDTSGGYWVVAHQGGGAGNGNQIWSWNFTDTGVGTKQISSVAGTETGNPFQGSLKINKCQTRLAAVYYTGAVEVYNWDQAAGRVTSLYRSVTLPGSFGYGCEFSPDGNILYITSLVANQLYQYDLTTNTLLALPGGSSTNNINEMGTLQLGPDDKIYVTNVSNFGLPSYIGVVNAPDVSGTGCNYSGTGFVLNNTAGFYPNIYRGIANQAWTNPTLTLNNTGACETIAFTYLFQTYFRTNVVVVAGSEEWDFGEGAGFQTGLGATPSHAYGTHGNYTVRLRVTDATCGKVWNTSFSITVNDCGSCTPPGAPTNITISTGRDICSDFSGSVTLTASGGSSGDDVQWFTGSCGGTLLHTGASLAVPLSTPAAGTYKYYVRRTNSCGNSVCIEDSIIVHELPVAPVSAAPATPEFCEGVGGNVNLTATGGSGERLVWYATGCGSGTALGQGTPLSVTVPGATSSYFARWESTGCTASNCEEATITIHPSPVPAIVGGGSVCQDSIRSFSTTASGNTFGWTFTSTGTGSIISGAGTNSIELNIGTESGLLSLTETDAQLCETTVSRTITVEVPSGPLAYAGADRNVCTPSVQLAAGNTAGVWSVLSGGGTFSPDDTTPDAIVSGLSAGANQLIWTVTGSCGYVSMDAVILTLGTSSLSVSLYANADTTCAGTPKQILAIPGGNGSGDYTFIWSSSDNSFNRTTTSTDVLVAPIGFATTYYLTIQDNLNAGCASADSIELYAISDQQLVVPNLITPNGDNKNDYLEIRDVNEHRILPGSSLEVVNRWGDRVYKNSNYDNSWNAMDLSDGVYYYHIQAGCGSRVYKGWLQIIH